MKKNSWIGRLIYVLAIVLAVGVTVCTTGCSDDDDDSPDASQTEGDGSAGEDAGSADDEAEEDTSADDAEESQQSEASESSSASAGNRVILCIGDSITEGVGTTDPYPSKLARITGDKVVNAGVTSQRSDQGVSRIQSEINRSNPTHVCILFGTNDVRVNNTGSTASNIQSMVNTVRAAGAVAIVGTIPPLLERGGTLQPAVDSLNGQIRGISGASIADIARDFGSGSGTMNSDGIHPNNNGAAIIAANFSERL